jgi:RNA polymerase sigma factor (sigma-70 family)
VTALARARFSQIVLPRLDEGYRLARWLTGNPTDAEDVMQEAALRAYRAIEDFAEGNARAWFLTIVRNACYSWLERHRSRGLVSSEALDSDDQAVLDAGGAAAEPASTPESALLAKERSGRLSRAIDALPVPLREALVLREYHGLSYREIAEVSGVPIGTVMSRLARARAHLLSHFDSEAP